MTIRPATPDDAGAIAQVHVEAWRTAYQSLLPAAFLATLSEEQRRSRWFEILTNSRVPEFTFVVESHGQIVGFTNGGPERTQDPELVGEIYAIYLLHEHRRHGIGTALFQRSVDFLLEHQLNSLKIWS